jgi:hypothetical protein
MRKCARTWIWMENSSSSLAIVQIPYHSKNNLILQVAKQHNNKNVKWLKFSNFKIDITFQLGLSWHTSNLYILFSPIQDAWLSHSTTHKETFKQMQHAINAQN